jgi:hypothetical protein
MQTNSFPALSQHALVALDNAELLSTYGGSSLLWDVAAFMISPGFGFFNLGFQAGYEAAANG